jgi:hypothetical protein
VGYPRRGYPHPGQRRGRRPVENFGSSLKGITGAVGPKFGEVSA